MDGDPLPPPDVAGAHVEISRGDLHSAGQLLYTAAEALSAAFLLPLDPDGLRPTGPNQAASRALKDRDPAEFVQLLEEASRALRGTAIAGLSLEELEALWKVTYARAGVS